MLEAPTLIRGAFFQISFIQLKIVNVYLFMGENCLTLLITVIITRINSDKCGSFKFGEQVRSSNSKVQNGIVGE